MAGGKSDETEKIVIQSIIKKTRSRVSRPLGTTTEYQQRNYPESALKLRSQEDHQHLSRQEADRKRSTSHNRLDVEFCLEALCKRTDSYQPLPEANSPPSELSNRGSCPDVRGRRGIRISL